VTYENALLLAFCNTKRVMEFNRLAMAVLILWLNILSEYLNYTIMVFFALVVFLWEVLNHDNKE
jgi:hypothetical protein